MKHGSLTYLLTYLLTYDIMSGMRVYHADGTQKNDDVTETGW